MTNIKISPGLANEAREYLPQLAQGTTIILDTIPGSPDNDYARQELQKLHGASIREFILPPPTYSSKSMVRFPLIRDREGSYPRAQGLDEIRMFVAAVLDARKTNGRTGRR